MSRRSVLNLCLDSEMRDDNLDYYNPENPLSVSPSGIGGNWNSQDHSSFGGNSGNTANSSRETLWPQNVTRTGSSTEHTRSYTSAPVSSLNLEHHLLPSSLHKTTNGGAAQTTFVLEQPEKSSRKKDKLMRSCMACFAKKQTCHFNHDLNRCKHCIGEDRYCRGAIHTPRLIDLDLLNTTAAGFSVKHDQASESSLPIRISLKVESNNTATVPGDRSFDLELQELCSVPGPSEEYPMLDGMLDQVFLASAPCSLQNVSIPPELATYECLCRRFQATISLLSNPRRCMLGSNYLHSQHTILAIVCLLCHLSRKASMIYDLIFDEIRALCNATRDPQRTPQIMFALTRYLGSMYKEIYCFEKSLAQWNDSQFWPRSFLLDPQQTLNGIKYFAMGLSAKGFVAGQVPGPLELGAIHITLHSVPCPTSVRYPINYGAENVCVLQALTCKSLQSKAREQPNSSTYDIAPNESVSIFDIDSLAMEFEVLTESDGQAMGDFDQQGLSTASTVVEAQDAFNFKNLPKDSYGALDAPWGYAGITTPLHSAQVGNDLDFAPVQPPQVSMINSDQNDLRDPATTYVPPLRGPLDLSNPKMPTSECFALNGILNETNMPSNPNLGRDATDSSQSADISPKRPIKRQRLKSLLPFEKKRLATNGRANIERSGVPEKVPAAMKSKCNDQASTTMPTVPILSHSNSLAKDVSLQIIRTDRSAEWDRRRSRTTDLNDAIVVKDVNIADSDRRPLSWPRRDVLRKDLDLSYGALLRSKLKNCRIAD